MKGKQVLLDTLRAHRVEHVFGNPGTTESGLLDALIDAADLRYVVALHEGVALGAAHHFAQAAGRPSVVNLHVAPGLGNALGMLYNAREAGSPVVVTAGQQDSRMLLREPLLSADLVAMAEPLVKWSVQAQSADELALVLHRAFKVAQDPPTGPVFVALPIDVLEQDTDHVALPAGTLHRRTWPDPEAVRAVADLLLAARRPHLVIGDGVAHGGAREPLVALAERLGAPVWSEGLLHHVCFPLAHRSFRTRLPADAEGQRRAFAGADAVVLVGGSFFEEVWFSSGSPFPEGAKVVHLEETAERLARNFAVDLGVTGSLAPLLAAVDAAVAEHADEGYRADAERRNAELEEQKEAETRRQSERAEARWNDAPVSVPRLMAELHDALPADAVVVNEAITAVPDLQRTFAFERRGQSYGTRGGGIGQALPGALGAQLAHPDRTVVAISGDGSAMYSIQALWTAAHHELPILFVILRNREYKILKYNMDAYRRRFGVPTERPYPHMDLTRPELDFVSQARGMGVEGAGVAAPEELGPAISTALEHVATGRPFLLDVEIERLGDG